MITVGKVVVIAIVRVGLSLFDKPNDPVARKDNHPLAYAVSSSDYLKLNITNNDLFQEASELILRLVLRGLLLLKRLHKPLMIYTIIFQNFAGLIKKFRGCEV